MKHRNHFGARLAPRKLLAATAACLLTALTGVHALAKPPVPTMGQLAPRASAPEFEAERVRPLPVKPDRPAVTPREIVSSPEEGAYVRLRDIPASDPPERNAAPRSHIQGEGAATQGGDAAATAMFRKPASSPPSALPAALANKAAGDYVRKIDGINDAESIWIPPDMVMATGPSHVVEAVNSGFSVYTKLGTRVELGPSDVNYWSFTNFFDGNKPADWQGFMFDPRIIYDSGRERFVMLALGKDDVNDTSYMFLALSETSDPTAEWCTRRIQVKDTGGATDIWLDYAGLGADTWGLYVTGNAFLWAGGKKGAQIRSFNTDIFDDCTQSLTYARFGDVQWPSGGDADSLQPAHPHTVNSDDETFFVGTYPSSGDKVLLGKLTGDRSFSASLTRVEIDIPAYEAISTNVDQPGSSTDIDGGKSKVQNAVYANRRVFFALTDDVNNDGSASGWLTVKLNTDLNTKEWHHLLWGGTGIYYFYPALTLQGSGTSNNLAVFGGWTDAETTNSASTQFPSGLFKIYENQPTDSTGPFVSTAIGVDSYVKLDTNNRNRWGDYGGASYDWTCGHAWGVVESADADDNWATTILAREFANEGECPLLEVVDPDDDASWASGTTQTVRWLKSGLPSTDEIYIYAFTSSGIFTIAEGVSPTVTSYSWDVPEAPGEGALLSVGSWDGNAYTAVAWSQPFTIVDATPPAPNPLTWSTPPTATAPDTITMTAAVATDGAGGPVEYQLDFTSSPSGGSGGSDSGWSAANAYDDLGLSPNHEYCYRARARDDVSNTTGNTPTECAYTLAADPVPAAFTNITGNRIRVNWHAGGNPPNTEYLVEGTPGSLSAGPTTATSRVFTGLTGGTTYDFRVRARNADGVATAWVVLGSATTLADDPDGDGVPEAVDNCLAVTNPGQRDTDGDGIGNLCDADADQSCFVDFADLGYFKANFFSADPHADLNGDGVVDFADMGIVKSLFFGAPGPAAAPNLCNP